MQFTRAYPEHLKFIKPLPVQADDYAALCSPLGAKLIEDSVIAETAWDGARCMGMAGVREHWPGRAEAWVILDGNAVRVRCPILRRMTSVLKGLNYPRIEMIVRADNEAGVKIAGILKMSREGLMRRYWPGGDYDAILFASVEG